MPIRQIPIRGNLNQKRDIRADEMAVSKNMFLDSDGLLTSRLGFSAFANPIPDSVVSIHACDAIASFAVGLDGANIVLNTSNHKRGTGAVSFDVDVSADAADSATFSHSSLGTIDISAHKGYFGFHFYIPSGALTDLTTITIALGSDSSNYYSWQLAPLELREGKYNFLRLEYADASTTGSPNDASIDYFIITLDYAASYTDKTGFLVDDLRSYSATSTNPVTSIFSHERDDIPSNPALKKVMMVAFSGEYEFEYDEYSESWAHVREGLTEFETKEGRTTERTRWSIVPYRNTLYMGNGVDYYQSFDGVTVTNHTSVKRYRYLNYLKGGDRVLGRDDTAPLTLDYTNAAPANANALGNSLVLGGDEEGVAINWIRDFAVSSGRLVLAALDNQIVLVDLAGQSVTPINTEDGGFSDRSVAKIGSALIYQSRNRIESLQHRNAAAGGADAVNSDGKTEKIEPSMRLISEKQKNANVGHHLETLRNYYFMFDTNNDNEPDRTFVLSTQRTKDPFWTEYTWPDAYDFCEYKDENGDRHFLMATTTGGQIFELETGYDDDGIAIDYELKSGLIDPLNPNAPDYTFMKLFNDFVVFVGYLERGGSIEVDIEVEGENVANEIIDENDFVSTEVKTSLATQPLATSTLTGDPNENSVDLFLFIKRIPLFSLVGKGLTYSMKSNSFFKLKDLSAGAERESSFLFPTSQF